MSIGDHRIGASGTDRALRTLRALVAVGSACFGIGQKSTVYRPTGDSDVDIDVRAASIEGISPRDDGSGLCMQKSELLQSGSRDLG